MVVQPHAECYVSKSVVAKVLYLVVEKIKREEVTGNPYIPTSSSGTITLRSIIQYLTMWEPFHIQLMTLQFLHFSVCCFNDVLILGEIETEKIETKYREGETICFYETRRSHYVFQTGLELLCYQVGETTSAYHCTQLAISFWSVYFDISCKAKLLAKVSNHQVCQYQPVITEAEVS